MTHSKWNVENRLGDRQGWKQRHHLGSCCSDQVRNDGPSDQDGSDGGSEKWSHSGYILNVEPTDSLDG